MPTYVMGRSHVHTVVVNLLNGKAVRGNEHQNEAGESSD
jgi:hypothetical protein